MAPHSLSQRDVEVLAAAFQSLKSPPDIDWDKLAQKANYKNGASARACFTDVKKRMFANNAGEGDDVTSVAPKKRAPAKSNKRKQPTPEDSSPTLAGSTPPPEIQTPTKKKVKSTTTTSKRNTKVKKSITPETDKDRINAKAIATGRARYAADKLAAEVKVEHPEEEEEEEEGDEENLGMNVDSGEDEGLTAYQLVKNEVFGEDVET